MAILNFLNKKGNTQKSGALTQPKPAGINPSAGVFYQSQAGAPIQNQPLEQRPIMPNPQVPQPMGFYPQQPNNMQIPNQSIPQATYMPPMSMQTQPTLQNAPTGIHSYQQTSAPGSIVDTSGELFGNDTSMQPAPTNTQPNPQVIPESKPVFADMPELSTPINTTAPALDTSFTANESNPAQENNIQPDQDASAVIVSEAQSDNTDQTQTLPQQDSQAAPAPFDFSDFKMPDLSGFKIDKPVSQEESNNNSVAAESTAEVAAVQSEVKSEEVSTSNLNQDAVTVATQVSEQSTATDTDTQMNVSEPSPDIKSIAMPEITNDTQQPQSADFDKDWYVAKAENEDSAEENDSSTSEVIFDELTARVEKDPKVKKDKNILQKIGISGLNSTEELYRQSLDNILAYCTKYNTRVVFDSEVNLGINLAEMLNSKGVNATGIIYKPFEAEFINDSAEVTTANASNITTFYYSNVLEQIQFFIKESRAFIIFNDNTFVTYSLLVNLIYLIDLYKASSKPVILIGKGWRNKLESIVMDLQIDAEVKKYITILDNANEIEKILLEKNNNLSNLSSLAPKVIDRRLQGDERDLHIAP